LAYSVINCNEGAFGQESLFDSKHQQLGVGKQWTDELGRQVVQGWDVPFRDEQAVSLKDRAMVQEGYGEIVFKHPVTRYISTNNAAKLAMVRDCIGHEVSCRWECVLPKC